MIIIAIDPSGEFPGGTTGVCQYDPDTDTYVTETIAAKECKNKDIYRATIWDYMKACVAHMRPYFVVEDFVLYAHKAGAQAWDKMETCRLLGIIEFFGYRYNTTIHYQRAADVMNRWSDEILEHKGFIYKKGRRWYNSNTNEPIVEHEKDALRHAVHTATFKFKGE